jgi:hypothetical protein
MLIVIPLLASILVFLILLGWQERGSVKLTGWRTAFLHTVLISGVFVSLQSELLGLLNRLALPYVLAVWLFVLLISAGIGWRSGLLRSGINRLIIVLRELDWLTGVSLGVFTIILALLLVIVVISPPNNTDSLLYHMARVVHWAEDQSLAHYPTGFEPQLTNPIGAELLILQLRLFVGSDKLASLPQWFSMIICAIAVSSGAKLLGAGKKAQLTSAAFAISVPMGLLQATSTQNDYVTGAWLTILALFVLYSCQQEPGWVEVFSIAAALGLGLLTKGTFYTFALAWGIWLGVHWVRQRQFGLLIKRGALIAIVVIVLNAGYWTRNIITYGGPLGPNQWISSMTSVNKGGLKSFPSNLVKDISLNFATPKSTVNDKLVNIIKATFAGSDPNVSNFQLVWRWNHEDIAGNPIHVLLAAITLIIVLALAVTRRLKDINLLWYSLAVLFSFVFFVAITHFDQYGTRYQLPLIIIWAPAFAAVIAYFSEKWLAPLAIVCFILVSLPYIFFNSTRPLIALKNSPEPFAIKPLPGLGITHSSSIFLASQASLLFANWPDLKIPYVEITDDIRDSGCKDVGLRIDSHDLEYTFWWLLKAPQSGIRVESIYYSDYLNRYADPNFKPCAIICTICGSRSQLHGLELAGNYGDIVKLFTGNNYTQQEGQ